MDRYWVYTFKQNEIGMIYGMDKLLASYGFCIQSYRIYMIYIVNAFEIYIFSCWNTSFYGMVTGQ